MLRLGFVNLASNHLRRCTPSILGCCFSKIRSIHNIIHPLSNVNHSTVSPSTVAAASIAASVSSDCFTDSKMSDAAATALLKASAFTSQPDYFELFYYLEDLLIITAPLRAQFKDIADPSIIKQCSADASDDKDPLLFDYVWKNRERMGQTLKFTLTQLQFRRIRERLVELGKVAHLLPDLRPFLAIFAADETILDEKGNPSAINAEDQDDVTKATILRTVSQLARKGYGRIDALGRAVAVGRRKSSVAKIFMVQGTGEIFINGRPMIEYFCRIRDRAALAMPLDLTRTHGRFNIWAMVRGGGETGQSGAIKLAISKALAVIDPTFIPMLKPLGMLTRDIRRVERKKYGRKKARKGFTWVKR